MVFAPENQASAAPQTSPLGLLAGRWKAKKSRPPLFPGGYKPGEGVYKERCRPLENEVGGSGAKQWSSGLMSRLGGTPLAMGLKTLPRARASSSTGTEGPTLWGNEGQEVCKGHKRPTPLVFLQKVSAGQIRSRQISKRGYTVCLVTLLVLSVPPFCGRGRTCLG